MAATELYTNLTNKAAYRYPREFKTDIDVDHTEITLDGKTFIDITITGIPDNVSALANEALVAKDTPRRLYIFSDVPLTEQYLHTLDRFYGKSPYKIIECLTPNIQLSSFPKNNFYLTNEPPSSISEFVEYRQFKQRHLLTNIAIDHNTMFLYKLVLSQPQLLVIIMPSNFIRTGLKTGYFRFDNNLIIRVYSNYMLSSELSDENVSEITVFTTNDVRLNSIVEKLFGRFGMHKIGSNSDDHIFAYDKFMTMVVGSVSNIALP